MFEDLKNDEDIIEVGGHLRSEPTNDREFEDPQHSQGSDSPDSGEDYNYDGNYDGVPEYPLTLKMLKTRSLKLGVKSPHKMRGVRTALGSDGTMPKTVGIPADRCKRHSNKVPSPGELRGGFHYRRPLDRGESQALRSKFSKRLIRLLERARGKQRNRAAIRLLKEQEGVVGGGFSAPAVDSLRLNYVKALKHVFDLPGKTPGEVFEGMRILPMETLVVQDAEFSVKPEFLGILLEAMEAFCFESDMGFKRAKEGLVFSLKDGREICFETKQTPVAGRHISKLAKKEVTLMFDGDTYFLFDMLKGESIGMVVGLKRKYPIKDLELVYVMGNLLLKSKSERRFVAKVHGLNQVTQIVKQESGRNDFLNQHAKTRRRRNTREYNMCAKFPVLHEYIGDAESQAYSGIDFVFYLGQPLPPALKKIFELVEIVMDAKMDKENTFNYVEYLLKEYEPNPYDKAEVAAIRRLKEIFELLGKSNKRGTKLGNHLFSKELKQFCRLIANTYREFEHSRKNLSSSNKSVFVLKS